MTEAFKFMINEHHSHLSGLSIPVFSLRTKDSSGIGQFSDLKCLADFAHRTKMRVIQLLPINDTTTFMDWRDSYPYRAISVFALHPIYFNLHEFLNDLTTQERGALKKEEQRLNALKQIDYERVLALKWKYITLIYHAKKETIQAQSDYQEFIKKNENWLNAYACFCVLRDQNQSADFMQWSEHQIYSDLVYKTLLKNPMQKEQIELHFFVQYVLHVQLTDAVAYCHQLGIAIKGDIAIGIAHDSADAWTNPSLFHLDRQTGAPPDLFAINGQNWGFPTYNWTKMAENGYQWWKQRMVAMSQYFDAYRLDHILGFFRIWEIPKGSVRGLLGQFSKALALDAKEIEQRYGIPFRQWGIERFTQPFIKDWVLDQIFGRDYRDTIIQNYLTYVGHGNYVLKPEYETQKKVEAAHLDGWLTDGLFQLIENVIFLVDHENGHLYHPRINLQSTISYQEFGADYKAQLDRLYVDYFYGRNYDFWKNQAYEKLPIIKNSTAMLACGEDLGMVPENVPDVMYHLEILRLIIERMPNDDHFVNPLQYVPYLSVLTTSSHDTSNLRAWWEENRENTQRYYNDVMGWYGQAPNVATGEIIREIITRHLNTDAMLVILPLQDWLGMDEHLRAPNPQEEQINVPAHPFHYWRYRLHIELEDLLQEEEYCDFLAELIGQSNRDQSLILD